MANGNGRVWKWLTGALASALLVLAGAMLDRLTVGHQLSALESRMSVLEERMEGRLIRELNQLQGRVTRLEHDTYIIPPPPPSPRNRTDGP